MGESDFECILWDFGGVFKGSPFYSIDNYAGHLGVKPFSVIRKDILDEIKNRSNSHK